MSFVLGMLLSIGAGVFAIVLWQKLPADRVGFRTRERRRASGFQGQMTEWLYWDATLQPPRPDDIADTKRDRSSQIADRALLAVVHRHATEHRLSLTDAHKALLKETKHPAVRAFLDGKMRAAVRHHWYFRYQGPDFLFYPWFYLIAVVRYGKRHLYLETLSAVLKELQTT